MRLKLDENLPHDLAHVLAVRGHDADTVLDEQLSGLDRLLDVHALDEFSGCVVVVEPTRIRVRRPDPPQP